MDTHVETRCVVANSDVCVMGCHLYASLSMDFRFRGVDSKIGALKRSRSATISHLDQFSAHFLGNLPSAIVHLVGSCAKLSSLQASPATHHTHVKRGVDEPTLPCSPQRSPSSPHLQCPPCFPSFLEGGILDPKGRWHRRRFFSRRRPFRFFQV